MSDKWLMQAAADFEAARDVPVLEADAPARRLHGHSFRARVRAALPSGYGGVEGCEANSLQAALADGVRPLDYRYLNDLVELPTDENLARWLRDRLAGELDLPGIRQVGIASTRQQGVDLDDRGEAHVWRRFQFEAAHQLPNVAPGHQCGRMHGHGFVVILHANVSLADEAALATRYEQLERAWQPLQQQLDHACLNDIEGLENPTSEMLCQWLWQRLKPQLATLSWVTVYETRTAGAHYDGMHYRIWKERRFESALRLDLPKDDQRSALHGHSYLVRLHLNAPLDDVLGWTVDYGDVKTAFEPAYRQLDHHLLNDLEGMGSPTPRAVLRWMRQQTQEALPAMDRIDLFETDDCGTMLSWGDLGPALPA
ncbi:MAG: 6-carboxytetrahydropterin synthase [Gammaproteobacteria bacterium]|nr:6-carboxytetrahydropterin synthase [Gammaproteobacteria bacterium]